MRAAASTLLVSWLCVNLDPTFCDVLISEVNSDNPGYDKTEYMELINTGDSPALLDGYFIVFYSGHTTPAEAVAYDVINLSGFCIEARQTLTIGSANVVPTPDYVTSKSVNAIQHGSGGEADGIALYTGKSGDFAVGMKATSQELVDAVVFSNSYQSNGMAFYPYLMKVQTVLFEDGGAFTEDESITRCSLEALNQSAFTLKQQTPGRKADCLKTQVSDIPNATPCPQAMGSMSDPVTRITTLSTITSELPSSITTLFYPHCHSYANVSTPAQHLFFMTPDVTGVGPYLNISVPTRTACVLTCSGLSGCRYCSYHFTRDNSPFCLLFDKLPPLMLSTDVEFGEKCNP